jgi:transketolase C-terminal domain/subunit
MAEAGTGARLRRIGAPDVFASGVGTREHLLARFGLDATGIARGALALIDASTGCLA